MITFQTFQRKILFIKNTKKQFDAANEGFTQLMCNLSMGDRVYYHLFDEIFDGLVQELIQDIENDINLDMEKEPMRVQEPIDYLIYDANFGEDTSKQFWIRIKNDINNNTNNNEEETEECYDCTLWNVYNDIYMTLTPQNCDTFTHS